jgi:uncharacterized protein YnzC (UPF0291/DUF896 family)
MSTTLNVTTTQAAILGRSILPEDRKMSAEMARFLIHLRLCDDDVQRMNELAEKARDGDLNPDEQQEIEDYRHVGHLLEKIKSQARWTLQQASHGG